MALREEVPTLCAWIDENAKHLKHSEELLCIYEGDLLRFIEDMFRQELGPQSFSHILPRIPPINVLIKIVDKLSRIYQESPQRMVVNDDDSEPKQEDQELLDWYIRQFDMDNRWNQGNEFLNLDKYNLMQPYYDHLNQKPDLRAIPNNRHLPYSTNVMDPTKPTHIITMMGKGLKKSKGARYNPKGRKRGETYEIEIYWAYTDEEFVIFDSDCEVRQDLMNEVGNPEGVNPFKKLPFTYINSSQNFLVPPVDTDTKRMTVLIPALLADLNYAVKFQAFSQILAFNIKKSTWTFAPNSVQFLDDQEDGEKKARVDTIKPDVDITEVINLTISELTLWLNSKGIRPGSIGQLTSENMASGVSKIVDEMDTAELRQKQATLYSRKETEFWETVLKHMHPIWVSRGMVEQRHLFSPNAHVKVTFPEQRPLVSRGNLVDVAIKEINSGLLDQEGALRRLNPEMSESEIIDMMGRINQPIVITSPKPPQIEAKEDEFIDAEEE